jgi:hypothetical protein
VRPIAAPLTVTPRNPGEVQKRGAKLTQIPRINEHLKYRLAENRIRLKAKQTLERDMVTDAIHKIKVRL